MWRGHHFIESTVVIREFQHVRPSSEFLVVFLVVVVVETIITTVGNYEHSVNFDCLFRR